MGKMATYSPLSWPFDWNGLSQFQKKVLYGIPFIGPQYRARKHIESQLQSRPDPCVDVWPTDEDTRSIVATMAPILQKYFNWPNSHFIPEDPFDVIFWDHTGDLISAEADAALASALGLPKEFSFLELAVQRLAYIDVVNRVAVTKNQQNDRVR